MMQWIDSDPERAIEELLKLPMDALIQRTLAVLYIWEKNFDKALVLAQGREREYCLYMLNNAQNKINAQINAQMDPLINAQILYKNHRFQDAWAIYSTLSTPLGIVNRLACLAHIDNQIDHQVDTEIQKFNYCCILIKSNQFQRAFNLLNEIDHFDLDPLDSESINLQLAYLSQKLGNLSAARSFYSLSYSSPLLLFLRDYNLNIMDSHSLLDAPVPDNLGFYQQAVIESNNLFLHPRNLDQALSRFPNNPKIILAKWKSVKPTTLAACLDLVAKYPASKVHLAKFHLDSNQPKMALEILEPLLSSFDSFVLHLYVNAMHCLDQLDLALNTLAALEQNQTVCIALAQAHLLQGNASKALDCYESALESDIVLAQYIQMAANHDPSRILKYKDRLNVPRVQEYHLDDLLQLPKASKIAAKSKRRVKRKPINYDPDKLPDPGTISNQDRWLPKRKDK